MASYVNVNIRMDADLKNEFEAYFKSANLSMTRAFNLFAREVVREKKLPFEVVGKDAGTGRESRRKEAAQSMFRTYTAVGEMMKETD